MTKLLYKLWISASQFDCTSIGTRDYFMIRIDNPFKGTLSRDWVSQIYSVLGEGKLPHLRRPWFCFKGRHTLFFGIDEMHIGQRWTRDVDNKDFVKNWAQKMSSRPATTPFPSTTYILYLNKEQHTCFLQTGL